MKNFLFRGKGKRRRRRLLTRRFLLQAPRGSQEKDRSATVLILSSPFIFLHLDDTSGKKKKEKE